MNRDLSLDMNRDMSRDLSRGMSPGVNEIGELITTIGKGADVVTETIIFLVQALALAQALAHGALPQVCVRCQFTKIL
jgi:hypothetical protein